MSLRQRMQRLKRQVRQVRAAARQGLGAPPNVNITRRANVVAVRNVGAPGRVAVASSSQSAPIVQTRTAVAHQRANHDPQEDNR